MKYFQTLMIICFQVTRVPSVRRVNAVWKANEDQTDYLDRLGIQERKVTPAYQDHQGRQDITVLREILDQRDLKVKYSKC